MNQSFLPIPEKIRIGAVWQGDAPYNWCEVNRKIYDYELIYFSRGRCKTVTEDQTLICEKDWVLLLPPDYEYVSFGETVTTRWCIHFDWFGDCPAYDSGKHIEAVSRKKHIFQPELSAGRIPPEIIKLPAAFKLPEDAAGQVQTLLRSFFAIYPDRPGMQLIRRGLFLQILGMILECADHSGQVKRKEKNNLFFCAKRIIDENFENPGLELTQIAAKLLITPNHLNKLFRQHLYLSPSIYLQNKRLSQAESLLLSSRNSIQEVAEMCGFSTANYFIRCFKVKNGVTPKKFRENQ